MQVVYPVGSSSVYLALDSPVYVVPGTELFTDCSLSAHVNRWPDRLHVLIKARMDAHCSESGG